MTYPEAIQFLYGLRLFGAKFGLENTFKLAALAGNPQDKLCFIHVAGTNGKGSTCAMLENIYRAAGLRVGLFTSPHLVSFRERIQVDRQLISESEVTRLVEELRGEQSRAGVSPAPQSMQIEQIDGAANLGGGGRLDPCPTFFEFVAVMALKFFAEQKCDLVIWEAGLGGRLDATNIVRPLASVITNIAFDHMQWLGDSLEKIAAEKAGIIKPGVPVITATDVPDALGVIERVAREKHAPLITVAADVDQPLTSPLLAELPATLTLAGDHQKLNAALALATVEILQAKITVGPEAVRTGLSTVSWPGRLQLIQRPDGQKILLDGAHNAAGATVLRAALEKEFGGSRPVLIFGALADKRWGEICNILAPMVSQVFAVPVASDRTADAGELAATFRAVNPALEAEAAPSLAAALEACKHKRFILITGSLYLVGEALEQLGFSPADGGERGLNDWTPPRISAISHRQVRSK
jgi:dihydrofolate synthase/folylpolyglutamate synthase